MNYMRKQTNRFHRLLTLFLSLLMLATVLPPGILMASGQDPDEIFAPYKAPIRYEMEDFASGVHKWEGSSAGVTMAAASVNTDNGSKPSGTGEAQVAFAEAGDYITLTLDNIPVSGDYLVYVSVRPVDANPRVYIRKDTDSPYVSEEMRIKGQPGGDQNSYFPRTIKIEGVMALKKGSDTFQIVYDGSYAGDKKLRVDYVEIKLVGGQGVVLTPDDLQPISTSDAATFSRDTNSDNDTAWGRMTQLFYRFGAEAAVGDTVSFPLTGLTPGDYYLKYAFKPRDTGNYCVFQTLADGVEVGEPVNQMGGSNSASDPAPSTSSNVQTADPIGIVTVPESGNLTISLRADEVHGQGNFTMLRMWLYPVPENSRIVESLIDDIPDTVSAADADAIHAARDYYGALYEDEQAAVGNYDKLQQALEDLAGLEPEPEPEPEPTVFDAFKEPIRYEMEDFYGTDRWSGSSAGVQLAEPRADTGNNGSLPSGGQVSNIVFDQAGDYITLTLDNIPVSGDYLVYLSGKPTDQNPRVFLRKDTNSDYFSENIRLRSGFGGDSNSYFPRTLKVEGVVPLQAGSDTIQIVYDGSYAGDKNFRADYIEIKLLNDDSTILKSEDLYPISVSDTATFSRESSSDGDTAWGNMYYLFYKFGSGAHVGSTVSFPLTGLTPGDYYLKYAFKPRDGGNSCVFQTLADGVEIGEPVDQTAGSNTASSPGAATTSNIQTQDPIGIVTVPESGNLTISLRAEAIHGQGNFTMMRMWLYPVPENNTIVEGLIADLPDWVTDADAERVNEVKACYDALTAEEQSKVENYARLQTLLDILSGVPVDDAVKNVIDQISALPRLSELTVADAEKIEAARTAYELLTEEQQAMVTNASKLPPLEKRVADLIAAQAVIDLIAALPEADEATVDDAEDADAAREAYDRLTAEQQDLVSNYDKLTALEAHLADLLAVTSVVEAITALPEADQVTLADAEAVDAARAAYNRLTPSQKALVTNYGKLDALELRLDILDVEALIEALPEPGAATEADEKAIEEASEALDALGPVKDMVSQELQDKLAALLGENDAGAVERLIAAIGALPDRYTLTIGDMEAILDAKADYDQLGADQQAQVTNREKLEQLVEDLAILREDPTGDVNGDGSVDIKDILEIRQYILREDPRYFTAAQSYTADLIQDDTLNFDDIMALRQKSIYPDGTGVNEAGTPTYTTTAAAPSDDISIQVLGSDRVKAQGTGELDYGAFAAGDIVSIDSDYRYFYVQLNDTIGETLVYAPTGNFSFQIPFDDENAEETGFAPGAFRAASNTIKARVATDAEISVSRNLALNAYDFRFRSEETDYDAETGAPAAQSPAVEAGDVRAYPHVYATRVWENSGINGARNAIDGQTAADGSGAYPYQAWDAGQYDDAEYVVYFGREVTLDSLSFTLRSDTGDRQAHDTYWESVTVQFSDGSQQTFALSAGEEKQTFQLEGVTTDSLRLTGLTRKENSQSDMWAALTELEAVGTETVTENIPAAKEYLSSNMGRAGKSQVVTTKYSAADVAAVIEQVQAAYEKDNLVVNGKVQGNCWFEAVYHAGMLEAYRATGNTDYYLSTNQFAESLEYMVNGTENSSHADWFAVGQNFIGLHELSPDADRKLADTMVNLDWLADRALQEENPVPLDFWWSDAFFMGSLEFTKATRLTGDEKYSQAEYEAYLHWRDKLWNPEYKLWARDDRFVAEVADDDRFPADEKMTAPSGIPIFWSRGNAWVFAYLAQQLAYIEDTESEMYQTLLHDFREYAEGIKAVQREDGTWNSSMADPSYYAGPESTGTAGFLYGYALGLRMGLLDKDEYLPVAEKAYEALTTLCMVEEGKIGYMQDAGDHPSGYKNPEYSRNRTNNFGMGLFYLGASAFMQLCADYEAPKLQIPMDNQNTTMGRYYKEPGAYDGPITATASSEENANKASKAFDGFVSGGDGVRWTASDRGMNNDWIMADLGKEIALEKINVHMFCNRDYQYKLEVSSDGQNWMTVSDRTDNTFAMSYQQNVFEPVMARYVRLTVTGAGGSYTGNTTSIGEILLYEYTGDGPVRTVS